MSELRGPKKFSRRASFALPSKISRPAQGRQSVHQRSYYIGVGSRDATCAAALVMSYLTMMTQNYVTSRAPLSKNYVSPLLILWSIPTYKYLPTPMKICVVRLQSFKKISKRPCARFVGCCLVVF